jgi:hypothetical protein
MAFIVRTTPRVICLDVTTFASPGLLFPGSSL